MIERQKEDLDAATEDKQKRMKTQGMRNKFHMNFKSIIFMSRSFRLYLSTSEEHSPLQIIYEGSIEQLVVGISY